MSIRIVKPDELPGAMWECEQAEIHSDLDDRVPFTQEEADAMAADPCAFGHHRFTLTAEEEADPASADYEGLMCLNGCGYGIG